MVIVKSLFTDIVGNTPFLRGAGQLRETSAKLSTWPRLLLGPSHSWGPSHGKRGGWRTGK